MAPLALLSLTVLTAALASGEPTPPTQHPPPSLRPLALLLQQPPAAANLIPGGRYAASRPGLRVGVDSNSGRNHDKPIAFPGNWPFVFPSSGKAATKTATAATTTTTTSAPPAAAAVTTMGASPTSGGSTLPLRTEAAPSRAANIDTVDSFSQVFGRGNSVLDGPQVSRCVWAIVTCCSPDSRAVRYGCFEQSGCHGAFWGTSPCDRHIARSAIEAALQFYL